MSTNASTESKTPGDGCFAATRWTLVVRSQGETPEARAALSELCEAYYPPVLQFLRSEGRTEDSARELTQEFFAQLLRQSPFDNAAPERGKFRSYLLGALKHFLSDLRKRDQRLKRGGGVEHQSIHAESDAGSEAFQVADLTLTAPDRNFDREWALQVMGRALTTIRDDFVKQTKIQQFDILKPWLMGEGDALSQASAASELGMTEGAVKVMIHRMRKRFREAVRLEISQTLRDVSLVDEELQHLIEALT